MSNSEPLVYFFASRNKPTFSLGFCRAENWPRTHNTLAEMNGTKYPLRKCGHGWYERIRALENIGETHGVPRQLGCQRQQLTRQINLPSKIKTSAMTHLHSCLQLLVRTLYRNESPYVYHSTCNFGPFLRSSVAAWRRKRVD